MHWYHNLPDRFMSNKVRANKRKAITARDCVQAWRFWSTAQMAQNKLLLRVFFSQWWWYMNICPQNGRNIFTWRSVTLCCFQVSAALAQNDDYILVAYLTDILTNVSEWHTVYCVDFICNYACTTESNIQYHNFLTCKTKRICFKLFFGKVKCVRKPLQLSLSNTTTMACVD